MKKYLKCPHSSSNQMLNHMAEQPLLWAVGPPQRAAMKWAARYWQSHRIGDKMARLRGTSSHPSSLPVIPASLD